MIGSASISMVISASHTQLSSQERSHDLQRRRLVRVPGDQTPLPPPRHPLHLVAVFLMPGMPVPSHRVEYRPHPRCVDQEVDHVPACPCASAIHRHLILPTPPGLFLDLGQHDRDPILFLTTCLDSADVPRRQVSLVLQFLRPHRPLVRLRHRRLPPEPEQLLLCHLVSTPPKFPEGYLGGCRFSDRGAKLPALSHSPDTHRS